MRKVLIKQRDDSPVRVAELDSFHKKASLNVDHVMFSVGGIEYGGTPSYYNEGGKVRLPNKANEALINKIDNKISEIREELNRFERLRTVLLDNVFSKSEQIVFNEDCTIKTN